MRIDRRAPAISNWNNMRARVARPAEGVPVTTIASLPMAGVLPRARQWKKDPGSVSSWPVLSSQFSAKAVCTDHKGRAYAYNQTNTRLPSLVSAAPSLHPLILERVRHIDLPN